MTNNDNDNTKPMTDAEILVTRIVQINLHEGFLERSIARAQAKHECCMPSQVRRQIIGKHVAIARLKENRGICYKMLEDVVIRQKDAA